MIRTRLALCLLLAAATPAFASDGDIDKVNGSISIDATQQEIQAIINGDPQKSSISLGGGKVHGRTLVDMTVGLLAGETVEKDQFMPITVIDKTNAQEYYDEMFGK